MTAAEMLPSSEFKHERLLDPAQYIRLLRVQNDPDNDVLNLELSTWLLKDAPIYRAISYTWGEERFQLLHVNDKSWWAQTSSYDALWQARLHWPETFL